MSEYQFSKKPESKFSFIIYSDGILKSMIILGCNFGSIFYACLLLQILHFSFIHLFYAAHKYNTKWSAKMKRRENKMAFLLASYQSAM